VGGGKEEEIDNDFRDPSFVQIWRRVTVASKSLHGRDRFASPAWHVKMRSHDGNMSSIRRLRVFGVAPQSISYGPFSETSVSLHKRLMRESISGSEGTRRWLSVRILDHASRICDYLILQT
jgi:hypothetical protein